MSNSTNTILEEKSWEIFEEFFETCRTNPRNINLFMKAQGISSRKDINISDTFDKLLVWDYDLCVGDPIQCLKNYCTKSSN